MTDDSAPARGDDEDKLDEELEESFPASDPPSTWARRDEDDEDDSTAADRRA